MSFNFFLMTETSFHASYLVTKWAETFDGVAGFRGIIVRENPIPEETRNLRELFHQKHHGQTYLTNASMELLREIYPDLSETEQAMIKSFGVPAHSATYYPKTIFLGLNLNSLLAKQWLAEACLGSDIPFLFVFLDQLLKPWWIERTDSQIINGHSAVLPYARGMFAIENVAISQNIEEFKKAAGATVHYIDTGIDTGPIIRAERLVDPFRFSSIWEQKGLIFTAVFNLLIEVAKDILDKPYTIPVGTCTDSKLRGPNFNSRDFTVEARKKAEEGYLRMKALELAKQDGRLLVGLLGN